MSEKAQEVRKRRLESMAYLKECAEIAFDFVLNELDEKTKEGDYTPLHLFISYDGTPRTTLEPGFGKDCDDARIGTKHHWLFFKMLQKMFDAEEGYTVNFICEKPRLLELSVNIDVG